MWRIIFLFVVFALLAGATFSQIKPIKDLKPTVVLISLDGFRWDYIDKFRPKTIESLANTGVRAKWMIPAFPTKTFPNHYTIATGLYPQNHGIVENNIWDFGTVFTLSKREEVTNSRWWLGEPIWVTAEKNGQKAGTFFFPGTEAEIGGKRPTFFKIYEHKLPNETRVDTVLSWLDLPKEQRPTMYTLYFADCDDAGHAVSPDGAEVPEAVARVDAAIGRLIEGLKARKIDEKVNIIIVSDHGMATVPRENGVILDRYINFDDANRILWTGEIVQIFPKDGKTDEIMSGLKNIDHASCWKKADIPARLHYSTGARVAPIVCSTEISWFMTSSERFSRSKAKGEMNKPPTGAHGYDNKYQEMQAIFVAHGKAFKKGKIVEAFPSVDVYNVMCKILKLKPAPNEGDPKTVKKVLK